MLKFFFFFFSSFSLSFFFFLLQGLLYISQCTCFDFDPFVIVSSKPTNEIEKEQEQEQEQEKNNNFAEKNFFAFHWNSCKEKLRVTRRYRGLFLKHLI